jgi:predicted Zn-dependent protease
MKAYNRADAIWVYTPQNHEKVSAADMKPIQHPNRFYLDAACGWLELGNPGEAQSELERMGAKYREHPEVLELNWQIAAKRGEWARCTEVAGKVIKAAPQRVQGYIHMAYALHELRRTQEAWDLLFPVAEKFPHDPTIKYNLACYATQLGRLWEAEQWLKLAFTTGDSEDLRAKALEDPDLMPIRARIGEL